MEVEDLKTDGDEDIPVSKQSDGSCVDNLGSFSKTHLGEEPEHTDQGEVEVVLGQQGFYYRACVLSCKVTWCN